MILCAEFFPLLQVPLCVAQIKAEELELSAFSDVYATFQVPLGDSLVVGSLVCWHADLKHSGSCQ